MSWNTYIGRELGRGRWTVDTILNCSKESGVVGGWWGWNIVIGNTQYTCLQIMVKNGTAWVAEKSFAHRWDEVNKKSENGDLCNSAISTKLFFVGTCKEILQTKCFYSSLVWRWYCERLLLKFANKGS